MTSLSAYAILRLSECREGRSVLDVFRGLSTSGACVMLFRSRCVCITVNVGTASSRNRAVTPAFSLSFTVTGDVFSDVLFREAASAASLKHSLPRTPQQHQHQAIHRARHGAADDHRAGDGEHLYHRPRDEALCLSQGKHNCCQIMEAPCRCSDASALSIDLSA